MGTGKSDFDSSALPLHLRTPEQFDLAVQDDNWLDRHVAELDRAVSAADPTALVTVLETARAVIAAMRRRRSGEDEAFGNTRSRCEAVLVNERDNTISVIAERNDEDALDRALVRLTLIGPSSMVENTMTPAESIAIRTTLERLELSEHQRRMDMEDAQVTA